MNDKKPFINVTKKGHNFTVKDSEFHGDRPTIKTAAKNTRVIRIKHFGQKAKDHSIITLIIVGVVVAVIVEVVKKIIS